MRKFIKFIKVSVYCVFAILFTALSGCAYLTPTRVPPLTKELGYKVHNFKGWTLVGLNEGKYRIEVSKLDVWKVMIDMVNKPALEAREQVVDWLNVGLSAGMFGGIPLALRKPPKGYIKKDA